MDCSFYNDNFPGLVYITPSILLQHSSLKRSFLPFKETTSHSDDKGNGTNLTIDIAVDITVIHMTHAQFFRQWYFVCPLFCCLYVYVYTVDVKGSEPEWANQPTMNIGWQY